MTQEPKAHEVARECQFTTFCNLLLCRDIAPSSHAYSLPDGYLHRVHNQKPDNKRAAAGAAECDFLKENQSIHRGTQ
jgi:hypothetical protein